MKKQNPMKIKDLINILSTKDENMDVVEAGIYFEEEYEVHYAPCNSSVCGGSFTVKTLKEAVFGYAETVNKFKEIPNIDFNITHKTVTIYGKTSCELIFSSCKRDNMLLNKKFSETYWKDRCLLYYDEYLKNQKNIIF